MENIEEKISLLPFELVNAFQQQFLVAKEQLTRYEEFKKKVNKLREKAQHDPEALQTLHRLYEAVEQEIYPRVVEMNRQMPAFQANCDELVKTLRQISGKKILQADSKKVAKAKQKFI